LKAVVFILAALCFMAVFNLLFYFKVWLRAFRNQVPLTYREIIRLKLEGIPPGVMVDAYRFRKNNGPTVTIDQLKVEFRQDPDAMRHKTKMAMSSFNV